MFKKVSKKIVVLLLAGAMVLSLAACGKVNSKAAAFVVNGETISMGTANTYLRHQQANNLALMTAYGLAVEGAEYWDSEYDETRTYGEYFKDQAQQNLINMVLCKQHAADYGFVMPEAVNELINVDSAKFINDNGSVASWIGATTESTAALLELIAYGNLMRDYIIADADTTVSDEEAAQTSIIYARLPIISEEEYDDDTKDYAAYKADLADEAKSVLSAFKLEKDCDLTALNEAAAEIDENIGVAAYNLGDDDTYLDDSIKTAVKSLKDGETYKDVIETENYYYVVKVNKVFDAEATANKKANIISQRQNQYFEDTLKAWDEASAITVGKDWSALKVTDKESYTVKQ